MSKSSCQKEYEERHQLCKELLEKVSNIRIPDNEPKKDGFYAVDWFAGNYARAFKKGTKDQIKSWIRSSDEAIPDLDGILLEEELEGRVALKKEFAIKHLTFLVFSKPASNKLSEEERIELRIVRTLKIIDMALKERFFRTEESARSSCNYDPPLDQ